MTCAIATVVELSSLLRWFLEIFLSLLSASAVFDTGKSASHHQRRPSSDNLSSFQPPAMFAAIARDVKANTLAKKAEANGNSSGSKLSRVGVRASMIEKKSPAQTRAPRFLSLDKGGCTCSMNGAVRSSVDSGSASLLYSAAHWLSLIKLAEGEKKHEVVVDLFRLAITLKAEVCTSLCGTSFL